MGVMGVRKTSLEGSWKKSEGGLMALPPPPFLGGVGGGADYQKIATKNKRTTKQKLATPPTSVPRLAWVVDHMVHRGDSIALAPLQIEYPPPPTQDRGCAGVPQWGCGTPKTPIPL